MAKHELEQEVLDEYKRKFDAYVKVCAAIENIDQQIFDLAIKKAAGLKMMIDYLGRTDVLPTKPD